MKVSDAHVLATDGTLLAYSICEPKAANAPKALVFFLHGLGLSGRAYVPLGLQLANAGYVVVLPDMRGCGRSEGSSDDVEQVEQHRTDAMKILAAVRLRYPGLPLFSGAHSVGCSLLMQLAEHALERMCGAFLLAPMWSGYPDYARKRTAFDHMVHRLRHGREALPDACMPIDQHTPNIGWLPVGFLLGSWLPRWFGALPAIYCRMPVAPAGRSGLHAKAMTLRYTYRHFASLRCPQLHRRLTKWKAPLFVAVGDSDEFVQPSALLSMLNWMLAPNVRRRFSLLTRTNHASVMLKSGREIAAWLEEQLAHCEGTV